MAVLDLVTLAEFKDFLPKSGSGRDAAMRLAITRASREIEGVCGRRLVYRAPPATSESAIIAGVAFGVAPAIANQPVSPGRTLAVTFSSATSGTLTITGTVAGVVGATEVFDAANGPVQHGVKFFTAVSGSVGAGGSGNVTVLPSQGYVEFHTVPGACDFLTIEKPFRQVLAVYEDPNLAYGAGTQLVEGTGYSLAVAAGRIYRVSSGLPWAWFSDWRAVKVIYSAGYFGAANVPADLKGHALHLAAQYYTEADKGQVDIASGSNALGSWTRTGPAGVTKTTSAALMGAGYVRVEFDRTGERLFDEEAA